MRRAKALFCYVLNMGKLYEVTVSVTKTMATMFVRVKKITDTMHATIGISSVIVGVL